MSMDTILDTQQRISEIIGDIEDIATLPEVAAKITQTVNDPRSDASSLNRVVSHDPALVARILKVVNSSFYARANQVTSVERAITLLGFQAIRDLAIAASLGQLFTGVRICEDYTARDLWTHSVAVAAVAQSMAQKSRADLAEQAFLAGLVHDIGLLGFLQTCPDLLREVCHRAGNSSMPFSMIELDVIGVSHEEVGAALAEKWGFPMGCWMACRFHHYPFLADHEYQPLVGLVHVADAICGQAGVGFSLASYAQIPEQVAFQGLVPIEVVQGATENLRAIIDPAIQVFS